MKKLLISLSLLGSLGFAATASAADLPMAAPAAPVAVVGYGVPPVVVQLGPTTTYSTIMCANFTKLPDGSWKALVPVEFGLGFVQHIVPPAIPIKSGGFIYNNIDLYSQLELQCEVGLVRARY
jgi:hypothetical protein